MNQALDLSKVNSSRAVNYKQRPVFKSTPIPNSIYQPDYTVNTQSPNFVPKQFADISMKRPYEEENNEYNIQQQYKRKRYSSLCSTDSAKSSNNSIPKNLNKRFTESSLSQIAKQEQGLIDTESLLAGMVYHTNMVRKYPAADRRTPEQAEYRRKNSQAARVSRARSKVIDHHQEVIAVRTRANNIVNKKTVAALCIYANKLNKLLHRDDIDLISRWKRINER